MEGPVENQLALPSIPEVNSIILLKCLPDVAVLALFLMFHLMLHCGNNFILIALKLIASPYFLVQRFRELFLMNENKVY